MYNWYVVLDFDGGLCIKLKQRVCGNKRQRKQNTSQKDEHPWFSTMFAESWLLMRTPPPLRPLRIWASLKKVRLWAAKCLAEVLRIFVPSPPVEKERTQWVLECRWKGGYRVCLLNAVEPAFGALMLVEMS